MAGFDDTAVGTLDNEPSTRDLSRHNPSMQFKGVSVHDTDRAEVIIVNHDTHGIVVKDRHGPWPRRLTLDEMTELQVNGALVIHHSLQTDDGRVRQ